MPALPLSSQPIAGRTALCGAPAGPQLVHRRGLLARVPALLLPATFVSALAGCASLPDKPVQAQLYDFGVLAVPSQSGAPAPGPLAAWVLADIEAAGAWDSTAMHYRLAFTDARALHAYALARWAMPPAQLLRHALRARLAAQRPLLSPGEAQALPRDVGLTTLRVEILEFSQLFDSAAVSSGVLRVQVTALARTPPALSERLLGQRVLEARSRAPSPDAAGGAHALAAAAEDLAAQLEQWLRGLP